MGTPVTPLSLGVTVTTHLPAVNRDAVQVTRVLPVVHLRLFFSFPLVATALYETPVTFVKETVTTFFETETRAPEGFDGAFDL